MRNVSPLTIMLLCAVCLYFAVWLPRNKHCITCRVKWGVTTCVMISVEVAPARGRGHDTVDCPGTSTNWFWGILGVPSIEPLFGGGGSGRRALSSPPPPRKRKPFVTISEKIWKVLLPPRSPPNRCRKRGGAWPPTNRTTGNRSRNPDRVRTFPVMPRGIYI